MTTWIDHARLRVGSVKGLVHQHCSLHSVGAACAGRLVYLATPYSREVVTARGEWVMGLSERMQQQAAQEAERLCLRGVTAISPIVLSAAMCHLPIPRLIGLDPLDAAFWGAWCQPLLAASGAVVVPDIPGWDRSVGVWREAVWAVEHGVPVYLYGGVTPLASGGVVRGGGGLVGETAP